MIEFSFDYNVMNEYNIMCYLKLTRYVSSRSEKTDINSELLYDHIGGLSSLIIDNIIYRVEEN